MCKYKGTRVPKQVKVATEGAQITRNLLLTVRNSYMIP